MNQHASSHADHASHAGHGGGHDAWHHQTAPGEKAPVIGENVAVGQLLLYGFASFMIIVVSVVATIVYFYWYASHMTTDRVEQYDLAATNNKDKLQAVYLEHVEKVENEFKEYGWRDDKNVQIPLRGEGGAFDKVIAEYAKKK